MSRTCLAHLLVLGAGVLVLGYVGLPAHAKKQPAPARLADQAQAILRRHCFECHGQNTKKVKGGVEILDYAALVDKDRKLVVPRAPDESELIKQIDSEAMPPGRRSKLALADREILRKWIKDGAEPFAPAPAPAANDLIAARVKSLFKARCFECHGGSTVESGLAILDRGSLLAKQRVVAGKPEESKVFRRITANDGSIMPRKPDRPLDREDVELVRSWIALGAPPFPDDAKSPLDTKKESGGKLVTGDTYIHKSILEHIKKVAGDKEKRASIPSLRFFSINHLLTAGAPAEKLEWHRQALVKAINHLTWAEKLVQPEAIEPSNTVYVVDISRLGWDQKPFTVNKVKSEVNLFDLVLLEYPYATLLEGADVFNDLAKDFLIPAKQVRPVVYVRADWFVSVATQPPLYEDLLQLPRRLKQLEKKLGVDSAADLEKGRAWRAGMARSGVSNNNRVVERHPSSHGAYWKSFDYRSGKGDDNIFRNPGKLRPAGGEMIFNLPNGLQGYFIANAADVRVEFAPTDIVTDTFAADKTVRNGLSCMRCHDEGMKPVRDAVRQAVELLPLKAGFDQKEIQRLYAPQATIDEALKADGDRFVGALKKALGGKLPDREPLAAVARGFLDDPLYLSAAAGELGLTDPAPLKVMFKSHEFAALGLMPLAADPPFPGAVRRDAWEDYYDQVVRALALGVPVVALDGLTRRVYQPPPAKARPTLDVSLLPSRNVLKPGDPLVITVKNNSTVDVFIEVVQREANGQIFVLEKAGHRLPPKEPMTWKHPGVDDKVGKAQFTLFASDKKFDLGVVLKGKSGADGKGVDDRFIHPFYRLESGAKGVEVLGNPDRVLKKTIEVETVR